MDDLEALQFLDDQYTVMLLVDLLRNPGLSITELGNIRGKRASPAKFNKLKTLISMGLMETRVEGHNKNRLYLSVEGQRMALELEHIVKDLKHYSIGNDDSQRSSYLPMPSG
ncbi:MAG: hypothetical protein IKP04_03420 [Candidatus Methanomethylophilaceae archaeon]|nr:hypothetical protein [Candidatus Methanomethylophilaceae archaeon]